MTGDGPAYLPEGTTLAGRYRVGPELGRGGFSVVYRARDLSLNTDVAIKLLVPPPAAAALARERMRREVMAVRGLSHATIVAVHDFLDDGAWSFVVMEYVAGPDLAARVRERGAVTPEQAVRIGRDVAAALAMAHDHGVIHRDVKPQNILLDPDGRARLTDFGSARLDGVTGVTRTGGLTGTLDYLAPELLAGRRGDGRADLYALGLTLHFALTARLPDRPSTHMAVPPNSSGHLPSRADGAVRIPAWLDQLVARVTAAAPERRFPSARALEEALAAGPQASAHSSAMVVPEARCALCGESDPFGLGLCVRCGGTSPHAADRAILVVPPNDRADRDRVRRAVHELLGGRAEREVADNAASGGRVLLRVPASSTGTVLEHLAAHGVPARAVLASKAWTALPLRYYALVMAMALVGLAAGAVVPAMTWAGPGAAAVWWVLGFREIRRPALVSVGLATPLPPESEREVVEALTELPAGTARQLLADIVGIGQRLAGGPGGVELGRVMAGASRAARQVVGLEESLTRLERRSEAEGEERHLPAHDVLARGRDRLVQELLQVLTSLGKAQGRVALAGAQAAGNGDGLAALALELEGLLAREADARREIEELLTS